MSAREVPERLEATVWKATGRFFQKRHAAYYAIAKALIAAKYPPELRRYANDGMVFGQNELSVAEDLGITVMQLRERCDRVVDLFHAHEGREGYFSTERWTKVCRRLARFLKFVDRRRAQLERGDRAEPKRSHAKIAKCAGCGAKLPKWSGCRLTPRGESYIADDGKHLPSLTADGSPPTRGSHGDNLVCSARCGHVVAVRLVAALGLEILDLLPKEWRHR